MLRILVSLAMPAVALGREGSASRPADATDARDAVADSAIIRDSPVSGI